MAADLHDVILAVHAPDLVDPINRGRAKHALGTVLASGAFALPHDLGELTRITGWSPAFPTGPRYDLCSIASADRQLLLGLRLRCHERAPHYRHAFAFRVAAALALDERVSPVVPGCDPAAGVVWVRMARWEATAEQLTVAEACLHAAARFAL